ncbi:hypothetical protein DYB37_001700 [Aphanomyces astaci]|uniref:Serine aminopeptidase S33 domain-containing protein n=1 Tax=Aphanomyces astaci TaxID=112090 RepID=A0A3R6WQL9_APHAT|nr:hypothetical protein DYB35_008288 [Aphanomyces astaci]RHZ05045.1 hypothetical protein DYB37_001700 [Aphanomyces astaci]
MLLELALGVAGLFTASAVTLRVLYGPGEEEAKERMDVPPLSLEVALLKMFNRDGVVLLVHGMNGHSGRSTPFFNSLLRDGWVAAAYDTHGFGRSSGRHGHVTSIAELADDALFMVRHFKQRFPNVPLFLIGGSMGGLTAVHTALKLQAQSDAGLLAGVIFHAPALHVAADVRPPPHVEFVGRLLVQLAPKLPLLPSVDATPPPANTLPLSMSEEEADPLFYEGRLQLGTGLAVLAGIEQVSSQLHKLTLPMLVQHGEADAVVPYDAYVALLLLVASSKDKTLHLYPGGGHLLIAEGEAVSAPFMRDMLAWLNARALGSTSSSPSTSHMSPESSMINMLALSRCVTSDFSIPGRGGCWCGATSSCHEDKWPHHRLLQRNQSDNELSGHGATSTAGKPL